MAGQKAVAFCPLAAFLAFFICQKFGCLQPGTLEGGADEKLDCSQLWQEATIYSEEQYCNALALYDKCGSVTKVITQLGYPVRRQTLYNWISRRKHLPSGHSTFRGINTAEHPRHPALELKLDAILRCFELGENVQSVSDEIGYPNTEIQKCVVHQIRNSIRYVAYKDTKKLLANLKPVYTAPTEDAALSALDDFEKIWGTRYPLVVQSWRRNWGEIATFFKYPPEIRKLIYTTNMIESYNRQLRKVTKGKAVFPNDESLLKMLYLVTGRHASLDWPHPQLGANPPPTIRFLPRQGQVFSLLGISTVFLTDPFDASQLNFIEFFDVVLFQFVKWNRIFAKIGL